MERGPGMHGRSESRVGRPSPSVCVRPAVRCAGRPAVRHAEAVRLSLSRTVAVLPPAGGSCRGGVWQVLCLRRSGSHSAWPVSVALRPAAAVAGGLVVVEAGGLVLVAVPGGLAVAVAVAGGLVVVEAGGLVLVAVPGGLAWRWPWPVGWRRPEVRLARSGRLVRRARRASRPAAAGHRRTAQAPVVVRPAGSSPTPPTPPGTPAGCGLLGRRAPVAARRVCCARGGAARRGGVVNPRRGVVRARSGMRHVRSNNDATWPGHASRPLRPARTTTTVPYDDSFGPESRLVSIRSCQIRGSPPRHILGVFPARSRMIHICPASSARCGTICVLPHTLG